MKQDNNNLIRCYATSPFECSYLPKQSATNLIIDPSLELNDALLSALLEQGFRRSGGHVYRPNCPHCQACISVRIPVERFKPNRSQRRNFRHNHDLSHYSSAASFNQEQFELYCRYLAARHNDSDMNNPTPAEYIGFLTTPGISTVFHEFRHRDELLAVSVIDHTDNGLSAVYTFFDPDHANRGLGSFTILWLIQHAHDLGLPWVYLGYWIEACKKMRYKTRFTPCEGYINGCWQQISPLLGAS